MGNYGHGLLFTATVRVPLSRKKYRAFALKQSDVKFLDKNDHQCNEFRRVEKVAVLFRGSKTDKFGEGATRMLGRSGTH